MGKREEDRMTKRREGDVRRKTERHKDRRTLGKKETQINEEEKIESKQKEVQQNKRKERTQGKMGKGKSEGIRKKLQMTEWRITAGIKKVKNQGRTKLKRCTEGQMGGHKDAKKACKK